MASNLPQLSWPSHPPVTHCLSPQLLDLVEDQLALVCVAVDLAERDGSRGYGVALVAAGDTSDENPMTAGNYSELE